MLSDTNVCDVLKTVYAADNSGVDFANQAKLPPTNLPINIDVTRTAPDRKKKPEIFHYYHWSSCLQQRD
jgi:hypothetical protein